MRPLFAAKSTVISSSIIDYKRKSRHALQHNEQNLFFLREKNHPGSRSCTRSISCYVGTRRQEAEGVVFWGQGNAPLAGGVACRILSTRRNDLKRLAKYYQYTTMGYSITQQYMCSVDRRTRTKRRKNWSFADTQNKLPLYWK